MCLRTFIKFTFSNKEAFYRALDKIESDNLGIETVEGQICLITDARRLDLNREPYEVIKDKASYIHAIFRTWKELKRVTKMAKDYPVCGEIIVEILNGYTFIDLSERKK